MLLGWSHCGDNWRCCVVRTTHWAITANCTLRGAQRRPTRRTLCAVGSNGNNELCPFAHKSDERVKTKARHGSCTERGRLWSQRILTLRWWGYSTSTRPMRSTLMCAADCELLRNASVSRYFAVALTILHHTHTNTQSWAAENIVANLA